MAEVGGLKDKVGSFKMSFPGCDMRGVEVASHPARSRLSQRIEAGKNIVREFARKNTPAIPGAVVRDWSAYKAIAESDPETAGIFMLDALQEFMRAPAAVQNLLLKAGVREITSKSDFPAEVLDTIEKYHTGLEEIDMGYKEIFDMKDFTGTKRNGFKIRDVSSGLTFRKVPVGDTVDVYSMAGTEVEVSFDRYGGALGWDKTWFDDEEFWTIDDTAREFRSKYYKDQASVFYALIEAVTTNDTAWQTHPDGVASGTAGYQAGRDVATINLAIDTIISDLKAADMNISPNETFLLLVPNALKVRVDRALASRYALQNTGMGLVEVAYQIRPIYTTLLTSSSYYYAILPKRKLKGGVRMDLTVLSDTDILAYTEVTAGWGRYGGGIGDDNQVRRLLIS